MNIQRKLRLGIAGLLSASALVVMWWAYAATLEEAFDPELTPVGYVGMAAVSSNLVTSGSETLYAIDYNVTDWSGNLNAYPIGANGALSSVNRWSGGAAAQVATQAWNSRKIVTLKEDGTKIPFLWASLSAGQQTAIGSENMVRYVRGDTTNETAAGGLRVRPTISGTSKNVLGAFIRSSPVYWVDPPFYAANGGTSAPTNCSSAVCKTVFVGGNGGMLHAFDATTGLERFAFVPRQLLDGLPELASPSYAGKPFVDGQIAVKAFPGASANQVVLAGALGGGGRGLFALDVSNPNPATESAAANMILWERSSSDADFANLGYVYGKPSLTYAQNGTPVLITGNGYNSGENNSAGTAVGDGKAYLMVINATTGALIRSIVADNALGSPSNPNGLSAPRLVDTDLDGKADLAFAGDLAGNLWRFDLVTNAATKLFTADDGKSITMAPAVVKHPFGGYMVTFVTGKLFTDADKADNDTHTAYGIWDQAPAGNTTLLAQTLTERSFTSGTTTTRVRTSTNLAANWATHRGWKTPLPMGGERLVGGDQALIEDGVFRFLTSNVTINPSSNTPGENWWMELNPLTGGTTGQIRFDLDGNGSVNSLDALTDNAIPADQRYPVGQYMGPGVRSQLSALYTSSGTVMHANYDRNMEASAPLTEQRGVAGGHFDVELYKKATDVCFGESAGSGKIAQGSVKFNFSGSKKTQKASYISISVGSEVIYQASYSEKKRKSARDLVKDLDEKASTNYTLNKDDDDDQRILITANATGTAWNGNVTVVLRIGGSNSNASASNYTIVNVSGGANSTATISTSSTTCRYTRHEHEYDDEFDKTGVNFLNASDPGFNLANALTSSQQFKVLMMNQYLSPAAMLHIGNASYRPDSAAGYVYVKNFQTSSGLTVSSLPTYTRANIGSLAINLPVDGFNVDDWWGNGDRRNGLHSSSPQCVFYGQVNNFGGASGSQLADMYTPVEPPANGATGAGTLVTTVARAPHGARHNGALTLQIISADTPQSAIEENVLGRPEYGWRVNRLNHYQYVLAEYTIFWHHPRRVCYGDATTRWYNGSTGGNGYSTGSSGAWNTAANMIGTGWTKNAPEDISPGDKSGTPVAGSTDPKLGTFGSMAGVVGGTGPGGGSAGGTGSSNTSTTLTAFSNIVTGGAVRPGSPAGGAGPGSGAGSGSNTPPTLTNVFGKSVPQGRINWREITP